jgi:sporulation protein YlmC with PRC-barrel domain
MLQTTNNLKKYHVFAADGSVGTVQDLYFDDEKWTIRYLVVHTGSWLLGRDVLISPVAFRGFDDREKMILTDLTKDKIEKSPAIDTAQPISRQHELEYFQYYGWPYYWAEASAWGVTGLPNPLSFPPPPLEEPPHEKGESEVRLRSTSEIIGYHIQARDLQIGHVEDFIVHDATWSITGLLVDTRNWWPGKKILIPHSIVESVSWIDRTISVGVSQDQLQHAPEYVDETSLTPGFHRQVQNYFERQMVFR